MQAVYNGLVSNTSCAPTVSTSASLDCLRSLPLDEINTILNGTTTSWPPVLDGDFIADYPSNQLREGRFLKVPVLIGTNADEGTAFGVSKGPDGAGVDTDADMRYALEGIIGADAPRWTGKSVGELVDELLAVYPDVQAVGIPSLDMFPVIVPDDEVATAYGLQCRRTAAVFGD